MQAIHHLAKLRDTLVQHKLKFEDFWDDVERDRLQINEIFSKDTLVGPSVRLGGISDGLVVDKDVPRLLQRSSRDKPDNQGGESVLV